MRGEHEQAGVGERPHEAAGHRRLVVGVVVAAVLAAGTGTALLAVTAQDGGDSVHPIAPVMRAPHTGPNSAVTLPAPAPAPALPAGSGGYRLTGALPADVPGPTAVYRPDAGPDREDVARLASALGLTGPVVDDGGSWRVGTLDGTGPALLVSADGPGTWSYARNGQAAPGQRTVVPPAKPKVPPPAKDGGATTYRATPVAPGTVVLPSGDRDPVSEQRARAVAAPVLDALGLRGAEIDASRTAGASRTVTANPVVGGLPTSGWETAFSVAQDARLVSAHGHLARFTAGERKAVVSARRAFEELPARRMMHPGGSGCRSGAMTDAGAASSVCTAAPGVGGVTVDVSGARFGLSPDFAAGGGPALVPSWLFTAAPEGSSTSYVLAQPAVA